jgi:iron complex outermembrane receptor protein
VKLGFTPNATNEYAFNYTKQAGEKGAPLNVYNNPPVPPNSYWRWPWWDVQNTSVLTHTQLGTSSYVEAKAYYNTFSNGLDAFDDISYTTQSAAGRFHSPYDDHAYGRAGSGTTPRSWNTMKSAFHYRTDVHTEQQTSRPTHPRLFRGAGAGAVAHLVAAIEDTFRVGPPVDIVGASLRNHDITKAEESRRRVGASVPEGGQTP